MPLPTHPITSFKNLSYDVKIEYVELRKDSRSSDYVDIVGFFTQPYGCMKGQPMHRTLDRLPLDEAQKFYPSANWYNNYISVQPSTAHLEGEEL